VSIPSITFVVVDVCCSVMKTFRKKRFTKAAERKKALAKTKRAKIGKD